MARKKTTRRPSAGRPVKPADHVEPGQATEVKKEKSAPPETVKKDEADTPVDVNIHSGDKRTNDPDWYSKDPRLLDDSSSLPYSYPIGDKLDFYGANLNINHDDTSIAISVGDRGHGIAGICSVRTKPTVGYAYSRKDPVNVCAQAFYTHLRYVNSGRKNYDPVDSMLYALAIADLYSFVFWCQRLYSYAFTYSARNKYIGDALLTANSVDPNDLKLNLANFRYWLNAFINKISAWVVPASIDLFKRKAFMYANLYIENPDGNIKDQLYQFVPDGFYYFDLDSDSRGMLKYKSLTAKNQWDPDTLLSVADIMSYGEALIANIYGDEDFGLISGDILKSYQSDIIGLASMPEELLTVPVYDAYVLSQMRNASIVDIHREQHPLTVRAASNKANGWRSCDIVQNEVGDILCCEVPNLAIDDPIIVCRKAALLSNNKLMTVENPIPGPADNIEASRLMTHFHGTTSFTYDPDNPYGYTGSIPKFSCGTEIVVSVCYNIAHWDGTLNEWVLAKSGYNRNYQAAATINQDGPNVDEDVVRQVLTTLANTGRFNQWKYSPTLYLIDVYNSALDKYSVVRIDPWSNIDNYTIVGEREINKMHECALLSLFYVPGVAKLINS